MPRTLLSSFSPSTIFPLALTPSLLTISLFTQTTQPRYNHIHPIDITLVPLANTFPKQYRRPILLVVTNIFPYSPSCASLCLLSHSYSCIQEASQDVGPIYSIKPHQIPEPDAKDQTAKINYLRERGVDRRVSHGLFLVLCVLSEEAEDGNPRGFGPFISIAHVRIARALFSIGIYI